MSTTRCRMLVCVAWAAMSASCTAQVGGVVEEDPGLGDPEAEYSTFTNYNFPVGAQVEVCNTSVGLNLRSGPGEGYMVLQVLANGTRAFILQKSGNWFKLDLAGGAAGWSYGKYLCLVDEEEPPDPSPDPDPKPTGSAGFGLSRDGIINVCKAFVGFSYWWGSAAFPNPWDNPQGKSKGKCYSATVSGHSGSYGADCSGYVSKVWQIPSALPYPSNKHPYSTYDYYNGKAYWSHISRANTLRADGLVYRSSSGAGHVVIHEKGNVWGSMWTYEARGCSWGVVHNLRNIGSAYRARRRNGV